MWWQNKVKMDFNDQWPTSQQHSMIWLIRQCRLSRERISIQIIHTSWNQRINVMRLKMGTTLIQTEIVTGWNCIMIAMDMIFILLHWNPDLNTIEGIVDVNIQWSTLTIVERTEIKVGGTVLIASIIRKISIDYTEDLMRMTAHQMDMMSYITAGITIVLMSIEQRSTSGL